LVLVRFPPPPFEGEGEFALWHFSEDASLRRFEPHVAVTSDNPEPLVWAIDTRHSPHFWFPRECPRGCAWITERTTEEDRDRFLGHSASTRLHVVESAWAERLVTCRLYAYLMAAETFESIGDDAAGYWVSREPVDAIERLEVGDLVQRHAEAGIELRITPDIWPFWHSVTSSTLSFSGSRLRNATRPEPPRAERGDPKIAPGARQRTEARSADSGL
jgi:hypothetical protein